MATSNYRFISVIQPPSLKTIDQPSLIRFETDYAAYRAKVEDVRKERPADQCLSTASIKDCMDSTTLHALCMIGEIEGASSVEDATAQKVKLWFENASTSTPKDLAERIDAALRLVSYVLNKGHPAGGVSNFIISFITALDQNNASEVLKDKDMSKKFIDRLVPKFKPDVLVERIKMMRRGWNKEQLCSIKLLKEEVASMALEIALTETELARVNPSKSKHSRRQGGKPSTPAASNGRETSFSRPKPKGGKRSNKRKDIEWTESCLNPDCSEKCRLKDCKNTPEEKKPELLDKYYSTRAAKKAKAIKDLLTASPTVPISDTGRFKIALEDTVLETVLGDSGADFSAIGSNLFTQVLLEMPNLDIRLLERPIALEGALSTSSDAEVFASRSVKMAITIYLPGSNIPVRFRGVEFLVVDDPMEEILLGRPFLHSIGFNLQDHLVHVRDVIHDKHLDELDPDTLKLAAATYKGLSYTDADEDPIELPECLSAGIREDRKDAIKEAFRRILDEAKSNGISDAGQKRLEDMLQKYRDVFRIKLGADPPADVPPLVITPKKNAKPHRSPQRRYAPHERDFIIQTIRELEAVGAIYKNPAARWASPALAVPKPGSARLRFTVDLRGPNACTVPLQSSMPHLDSKFQDMAGSTCFANLDLAHGYWQLPLSKESQEIMSIQTPLGVYSSKRLLQWGSDSGNHFQAVLAHMFEGRVEKFLQWLDDFVFCAKTEAELLSNVEHFMQVCQEIGLKIQTEHTHLFRREVPFYGRIISSEGSQYHPRHYDALVAMKQPTMATILEQFVCGTNWMRSSIPDYARRIAPLHQLLED